jgi:dTDP-4-dehydrorhamnose reductase
MVIGADSQVGRSLIAALNSRSWPTVSTDRRQLDIRERDDVLSAVLDARPEVILLPAAVGSAERCELEPAKAWKTNVDGVCNVARAAKVVGADLVFYSSDYVFNGANGPYSEEVVPSPINAYGRMKLEAEHWIREITLDRHLIIRTSVVFSWSPGTRNFAMQLWQRLSEGQIMRVPYDQLSTPTLSRYLAETTLRLLEAGTHGLINVAGRDSVSRAELAVGLARAFRLDANLIEPVATSELRDVVPRALSVGLTTNRLERVVGCEAMPLEEAIGLTHRQWTEWDWGLPTSSPHP